MSLNLTFDDLWSSGDLNMDLSKKNDGSAFECTHGEQSSVFFASLILVRRVVILPPPPSPLHQAEAGRESHHTRAKSQDLGHIGIPLLHCKPGLRPYHISRCVSTNWPV